MAPRTAPKRRPGRPSILTEKLADEILGYVRDGAYIEVAARAAGIVKQTLYNWRSRAAEFADATQEDLDALDDETALLVWFVDALEKEEALTEVAALRKVRERPNRWQAEAWFLERRHQRRYRQVFEAEHSGEVAHRLSPAEVEAEMDAFGMPAASAVAAGPEAVEAPPDA